MNFGKTYFSEAFPELWLFLIGSMFIGVVMLFPDGLAGLDFPRMLRFLKAPFSRSGGKPRSVPGGIGVAPEVASAPTLPEGMP
jgi:urea transport system permease protein